MFDGNIEDDSHGELAHVKGNQVIGSKAEPKELPSIWTFLALLLFKKCISAKKITKVHFIEITILNFVHV